MAQRLFFCITNHHLVVYPWSNNSFGEATTWEQGGRDLAGFQDYLNGIKGSFSVLILIDLTEEELKLERIPRLNPFNRTQMLQSRANRLLRNSPFRHYTLLGRDPQDKNQDCVLFSGLTDPEETVLPWLTVLYERRIALVGIWSIPLLTPRVFRGAVDPKHQDVLLLSINSGGLRQTFLREGQMLISRLSRLPSHEAVDLVPFLLGEVARMQGYLVSLRLYAWNSELHVYILSPPDLYSLLQASPAQVGTYRIYPVDVTQLTAQVGLKNVLTSGKMDRLFGQCILRWSIPNHYARPFDTIVYQTLRLRRHLHWSAMGLFVISLIIGLFFFLQGRSLQDQQPDLSRRAEEIQQSLNRSPNQPSFQEGRRIISAVQWADLLTSHAMDPRAMYLTMGELLAKHETLLLDHLEWSTDDPKLSSGTSPSKTPRSSALQVIQLAGRVSPFKDLKQAMGTVEGFMQELRSLPQVQEVQAVELPMNLGHNQVIQGGEALNQEQAVFRLKILMLYPKKIP
ncbi:MAG: hypothetical protein H7839_03795 [Magnetococcus sp. YQC-5]